MLNNFIRRIRKIMQQPQFRKHHAPAADRNKDPILNILKTIIPAPAGNFPALKILEISSGTGQHISHFAANLSNSILWQPSEFDIQDFESIKGYIFDKKLNNVAKPIYINITDDFTVWNKSDVEGPFDEYFLKPIKFEPQCLDYIYNANMMHISPFECTVGLFKNAGVLLKPGGLLITYGPYARNGVITPQSNVSFHFGLKNQNPSWGLRDVELELVPLALENKLTLVSVYDLPANNNILIWKKKQ